jgi:signal transduction histidine kinase
MKVPTLGVPRLAVPRLGLASFRRRLIFRGAFLLLVLATLALALAVLREEKQRSTQNYRQNFSKTEAEIVARLRNPVGQLALLNPYSGGATTPLKPLLLPYSALDFDDQNKAQQAIEMAGCSVQYPGGASVCVAIGNNPYAGGFLYLVGSFLSSPLVGRAPGTLELLPINRARITLNMRGEVSRWIAPFEAQSDPGAAAVQGRLTGFVDAGGDTLVKHARPVRDFRGWLWQSGPCVGGPGAAAATPGDAGAADANCARRAFFSIRLPVDVFREALFQKPRPVWPPPDLQRIQVRVEMFGPGSEQSLFDSNAPGATPPFSLGDLAAALQAGETLRIRKAGAGAGQVMVVKGVDAQDEVSSPWLAQLVRRLPVEGGPGNIEAHEVVATSAGSYDVDLSGDLRGVDSAISVVATRLSWFVAAMLGAIVLAWLVIEIGLIRRIAVLTKRAAAVSYNVQDAQAEGRIADLDVSDLRGSDELGILAGGLSDLLKRVKDDVRREHIRAQQERDLWHAVGHEIMSPLQSLMVLHAKPEDPSNRYIARMQQAVRVLYGTASPSEALEAAALQVAALDLNEFLHNLAANAHFAGVDGVRYARAPAPVMVRADEFPLEDVVTHILRNADRHRLPGTPITLTLSTTDAAASVAIHNQGPAIEPALIERIFEYGVSDDASVQAPGRRGQGLFVAKTYMAKMGGTVAVSNVDDGVSFVLALQRAA